MSKSISMEIRAVAMVVIGMQQMRMESDDWCAVFHFISSIVYNFPIVSFFFGPYYRDKERSLV